MISRSVLLLDSLTPETAELIKWLKDQDYHVDNSDDINIIFRKLELTNFDILIINLNSVQVLYIEFENIHIKFPQIDIIFIADEEIIYNLKNNIKKIQFYYLNEKFSLNKFIKTIQQIFNNRDYNGKLDLAQGELSSKKEFQNFIAKSKPMLNVIELIKKTALKDIAVLIQGERGVGKELLAKIIHENSLRNKQEFYIADFTSLNELRANTLLFGSEKETSKNKTIKKIGLIEKANRSTLFIDEICHLKLNTQNKLFRFLESKNFERIGGEGIINSNVRLIVSTCNDLLKEIADGRFRSELFYALTHITLPPLKERMEDIPILIEFFINKYNKIYTKKIQNLSENAQILLLNHEYIYENVRQLENTIKDAVFNENDTILSESVVKQALLKVTRYSSMITKRYYK